MIEVTAVDTGSGDRQTVELKPGMFVVTCAEPMYVAHEQHHRTGTVVITLKKRQTAT